MKILKRSFEFYLNSSIHVALAVTSLVYLTYLNFEIPLDKNLIYFTFFSTISSYNFVKYFGLAKFHHRSLALWLRQIQIFSFLCFIPLIYFALQLPYRTLVMLGALGLITFLYAMPLLPRRIFVDSRTNLRTISGLKIYVIAIVWAVTAVIVPFIQGELNISSDAIIMSVQLFIYVIVAMLPFEIRDMRYDSIKLATIPQQIGIKQTKIIGIVLALMMFFLEFLKDELHTTKLIILLVVSVVLLTAVLFSKTNQSKYYSAFWVESIPLLWVLMTLLML